MSFKLGQGERSKDGRLFNDQDEASLAEVLGAFPTIRPIEFWRTGDRRPGWTGEIWLNCLAQRAMPAAASPKSRTQPLRRAMTSSLPA